MLKSKNRNLRTWCRANKITLKELAASLKIPYQAILQVSSKRSHSLRYISLIHAYTLLPLEVLLPHDLRDTVKQMKKVKEGHKPFKIVKARRKIFTDSTTYPIGSQWAVTYEDSEIIRLEINGDILHVSIPTYERFFREVPL